MEAVEIKVTLREVTGKGPAHRLRAQGVVPAVAYGPGTDKTLALTVNSREVVRVLNQPTARNTPVTLVLGDQKYLCLVHNTQVHPVSRRLLHVDFLVTHPEHTITAVIPLEVIGKSKGEEAGASRYQAAREIKVTCFPNAIPEKLVVDCTPMDVNDVLYVNDIVYPEGVKPVFKTRYPVLLIEKAHDDDKPAATAEAGAAEAEKAE